MVMEALETKTNENKPSTGTIDIVGDIGWDVTSQDIRDHLKNLPGDTKELNVNIDSLGGYVSDALSIHDMLSVYPAQVNVTITGMTASAATVIAMSGDNIKMSDNALFLIHNAKSIALGDRNDMTIAADDLNTIDKKLANIYVKKTGASEEQVLGWMNAAKGMGEWWTASEAKEMGFIDEVFEPKIKAVAMVTKEQLGKMKLPMPPQNYIQEKQNSNTMDKETRTSLVNDIVNAVKGMFTAKAEPETKPEPETKDNEQSESNEEPKAEATEVTPVQPDATKATEAKNAINDRLEEISRRMAEIENKNKELEAENARLKAVPKEAANAGADPEGGAKEKVPELDQFFNGLAKAINSSQKKNHRMEV